MLKDADPDYFDRIYIVCGYTDLHYGIDSLAAIIELKYKMKLFVPNTLFLFCGRSASKIKGLLWEGDGFLLLYKRVETGHFSWPRNSDELLTEQIRIMNQRKFGRQSESNLIEGQLTLFDSFNEVELTASESAPEPEISQVVIASYRRKKQLEKEMPISMVYRPV